MQGPLEKRVGAQGGRPRGRRPAGARGAPGSDADDPAQSVADRAGAAELETLVRGLREPYGKIAVLYFLEHRETAEIAKLVSRPPATVNSQLWRAKLLLRQQITERRQKE